MNQSLEKLFLSVDNCPKREIFRVGLSFHVGLRYQCVVECIKKKRGFRCVSETSSLFGGAYETRTRDPLRDRQIF